MLKRKLIILAILVLAASMVFAVVPAVAANGIGYCWVRVAHASPDAPAVDVWVNGQVAISNLAFADVTDYLLLPAGDYNFQVTPTGATTPVVIDADVTLDKNVAYTVAARGYLTPPPGGDPINASVFIDDNDDPDSGMAKVNFIHLSPDAPAVDVSVQGGPLLFSDIEFKEQSTYVEVDDGTYTLEVSVFPAGPVVLTVPDVDLDDETVYTIFAEGLAGGGPPALQAVAAEFTPEGHIWYLAEGCTEGEFETFVLVQNPNPEAATVGLTFMTENGPAAGPSMVLDPNTRYTWKLNDYVTSWQVSTEVTSDKPVVAERAMYNVDRTWAHDSIGTTQTAGRWFLAEGATAGDFETFVLVQNPNPTPVYLDIIFMTSGTPVAGPTNWELAGHSRITFYVNSWVTDFNVSTDVQSTGGEIICERAMWGNNRAWAHNSIGYAR
ncbi:MAG: DUF4397 domain-containing protein [Actinomycetota bacterium]|nr:DUF4397 domain-containing protein [Actinomycetota bacterium]